MKALIPRKLHRGHFAFMRALAQGLDERASWDRYLRLEGEHTDLRTVRRTIAWIRDEFAAAARREHKPGTARLILLDADRFSAAPALPSLAEFAVANGLEDFSESEQVEAYEAAYPAAGKAGQGARPSRRARVVERQLEALRWLENLVAQDPRPLDSVSAWLNPSVASRLERAGLPRFTRWSSTSTASARAGGCMCPAWASSRRHASSTGCAPTNRCWDCASAPTR